MNEKKIIIAIDGFASCGKSTLARQLAEKLGYVYIDSGAIYRALMLYFLKNNLDFNDPNALQQGLSEAKISFRFNPQTRTNEVCLNGRNVESEIRDMRVSRKVSELSKIKAVRQRVVELLREIGKDKGIVMDGRDIGTVVFPDAELKLFVTADFQERIRRRYEELKQKGVSVSREEIAQNLRERDEADIHRKESPLRKAPDAVEVDNTHLTPAQQLQLVYEMAWKKIHPLH
ncbi:MAG: cytidylate kinase [Chitinophagales bacterium]|nr:MAG: cytidylate kinase [Chitinophagales bacterium]